MSLRPRSGEQVPPLTARIARASKPDGTTAIWVRDRLDGLWCDEDFTDWYPRDGLGLDPGAGRAACLGPGGVLAQADRAAVAASPFLVDQVVQQVPGGAGDLLQRPR
ncbi:hypothetical protein [Streptomyces sp. NPDC058252]|uniref:hypothetical protein n=1 Tax=Streptomyces sp. NPDC058252 TaxID=3346405 RepID=UPI0036EDDF7A